MSMKRYVFSALAAAGVFCALAGEVRITVDPSVATGPVKPVNGVGQPPMIGQLGSWGMMHYLKDAGVPYSRLHDVGGWLGRGLYVDIPNLFPDFEADETKPANYRFAYTDSLISALVENGVEPFFRLGVTIENFVKNGYPPVRSLPPADHAKWARICEHVIRHYTEGWAGGFRHKITYWEIWNEPDFIDDPKKNAMWGAPFSEYVRFYGTVAPYLKSRFPHLKIGGYGSCGFYAGIGAKNTQASQSTLRAEYFIRCADEFLSAAKDNGWPLDFFSFHSYSAPSGALRQVEYAHSMLNGYGFTSDRTERIFNEWLPFVKLENLGSALQAAGIAAEIVGLQNGPCDLACLYDARCGVGNYSPLFNPLTQKPHKAYYGLVAFNELRKLGSAVRCLSSDQEVYAAAAASSGKIALMAVNMKDRPVSVKFTGLPGDVVCRVTDGDRTWETAPLPESLTPHSIWVVTGPRR